MFDLDKHLEKELAFTALDRMSEDQRQEVINGAHALESEHPGKSLHWRINRYVTQHQL